MTDLPLWVEAIGALAAAVAIIKGVSAAWYRGTIYQVQRMQDEGDLPEMAKLQELEMRLSAEIKAVDVKIENGIRDELGFLRTWQTEYGAKIDQLVGQMHEHLRREG